MKKINLKTSNTNVPIYVGNGILNDFEISKYVFNKDVLIITNTKVGKLYLNKTKRLFKEYRVNSLVLPDGEKYKNNETLKKIYDFLVKNHYDRSLTIVALGGGVIGDLVAFAADTFMRGVSLIHIPTTLLSQVDSSIGGKCGINHKLGKNLIGSFKHPNLVLIDTSVLKSLPKREFLAGMAEVIKYGLIKNKTFFNFLNNNYKKIYRLDEDYCEIEDMILRLGLPTQIPKKITSVSIMKHLGHDKKKVSGKNRFILLNNIGSAFISDQLDNKYLEDLSKNFIS